MLKEIKIKKGLDIKLQGRSELVSCDVPAGGLFALCPDNFHGLVPQMLVKPGDRLKAGDPVFCSKYDNRILVTSPVSGEVLNVVRGAKRRIIRVEIRGEKEVEFKKFKVPSRLTKESVKELLMESGVWSFIKQRPFDVVAAIDAEPKAVFISAYSTTPLGPDYEYCFRGKEAELQKGIDVLAALTEGKVYMGVDAATPSSLFRELKGVEHYDVSGPHPAGNVGVQINKISPVNKGERVFVVSPADLLIIGSLFAEGRFNAMRKVAVAGPCVEKPCYANVYIGAQLKDIVGTNFKMDRTPRYISGSVLTGYDVSREGFLGWYDVQVTLIPDGSNDSRFLGWIMPNFDKYSVFNAGTFSWLMPDKKYALNNNSNGGERNFVVTGVYEKVFPMDIYPVQLVKAAITGDMELMEELGIYEVAPEDFALCSFVCPSKIDHQSWIRKGLDLVMNN